MTERRVSIFVCGVQKGGTTSLHAHLREHPGLSPPNRQEVHFFDDERRDWRAPDYAALHAVYPPDDPDRRRFDVTPIYGFWPPSILRIRAYDPSAKLIFLFRDPFDRAWSQWCMEYARGDESLPFAEAIRSGRRRMDAIPPLAPERRVFSYLERGLYGEQARRALACFPREQVLFLRSESMWEDHVAALARIADFLGLAPFPDSGPKRERARPEFDYPSAPTEGDRALVADFVKDDLADFAETTGVDVSAWPTFRNHPRQRVRVAEEGGIRYGRGGAIGPPAS